MTEKEEPATQLLRIEEVSKRLAVGRSKTYEMILSGEIGPTVRIGRAVRVPAYALDDWLKEKTAGAATPTVDGVSRDRDRTPAHQG